MAKTDYLKQETTRPEMTWGRSEKGMKKKTDRVIKEKWMKKTDRVCRNHCLSNQPFVVAVVGRAAHFQKRCQKSICPKFPQSWSLIFYKKIKKTWQDSIWQTLSHLFAALLSEILPLHHAETFPSCWKISIMLKHFHHAETELILI